MKLTNTVNGKHYFLSKKQVEMYKYFEATTKQNTDIENPHGYFYFTIREYGEKYGSSPAYAHRAISTLKAINAIEYVARGQGKSIVRCMPGFTLTEF